MDSVQQAQRRLQSLHSIAPVPLDKWGQKEHIAIRRHGKDDADQGF